jgi:putative ABC transport system permease protein
LFSNYLTTALRNIARHKLYSFINIAGLALGLTCAILIVLFVRDELSYDSWLPDTQNLYRVELTTLLPGQLPMPFAVIPYPLPAALANEIPDVTGMTLLQRENMTLTIGEHQFAEQVNVVDPQFLKVIKLKLLLGDPESVFRQPESVVVSQSYARKYFGGSDPVGKIITTGRGGCADGDSACKAQIVSLRVTGVVSDIPHNSQLMGDVFIPSTSIADRYSLDNKQDWLSSSGYGYITLAPGVDPARVISKAGEVFDKTVTGRLHQSGISITGSQAYKLSLTPFRQVHLTSNQWLYNLTPAGSWATVYGIGAIGLLILLIACFNFTNLATARSMLRAREIALRKTFGGRRKQIILQFLGEAVLTALIALLLALALTEVLLPAFGSFLQHPITLHYLADWPLLLLILTIAVIVGLVGGIYPSLVLSGFRPADVFRANSSGQSGSGRLRTLLVVVQFSVSIGLGIIALVVFSQVNYVRNMGLGFNRDNILVVGGGGHVTADGKGSFAQTLRAYPGILDIGMANFTPFDGGQTSVPMRVPGRPENLSIGEIRIDPQYPKVLEMHLVAGRLLSDDRSDDQLDTRNVFSGGHFNLTPQNEGHNILINASAAARFGYRPQDAVDKTVILFQNHVHIVGVLADANYQGARELVSPTIYDYQPTQPASLLLRLRPGTVPETLAFIDKSWRAISPITAIQRHFLDDSFDTLYQADQRQGAMFDLFVAIAILIACMGLFGLAALTVGRRTKEIGIRKVFGARVFQVVWLLLTQFSAPVLLANLIAWPLAWYYLDHWLQGFAYRITLSPLYFAAVGLAALAIAWVTVLNHALRVANANPIHALRYE